MAAKAHRLVVDWAGILIQLPCRGLGDTSALLVEHSVGLATIGFGLAFLAFGIYVLWWKRSLRTYLVFAGLFVAVVVLCVRIQPSFNRAWQTDLAVLPQVLRDGDRVLLKNSRNFDYRSTTDFTPHYESREVCLSHLTSLDFYVSYWMPGPVAHTFLSFNSITRFPCASRLKRDDRLDRDLTISRHSSSNSA